MDIVKLLKPQTVAIIGASEKEGTFGGDICTNIKKYGKLEKTFFVNPKWESVHGKKCYRSVDEIPGDVDVVIICTPKKTVNDLLRQAGAKGCRGAVVFASGYSEVGNREGKEDEKKLIDLCQELDIALMGPNCAGFINYRDGVVGFPFISQDRDRKGNVGLVAQSGQLCLSLMESPNIKFSYVISAGNSPVITIEDYLDFLVEDADTKVVSAYFEGLHNPKKFAEVLKKAALKRKPVVVLKTGRSVKGSQIAASHTGSMSGADEVFDAVFRKFGVIRVKDMEELLAASVLFSVLDQYPAKDTFAAMNLSGGETGICADVGYLHQIKFPDFTRDTNAKLVEMLPYYATPNNPLDTTTTLSYDSDLYAKALRTVMDDPQIGMVLIGYTLLLDIADPAIYYITEAIEKVIAQGNAKPIAIIPFVENTRNQEYLDKLENLHVPILPPTNYAFSILNYLADFVNYRTEERAWELALPDTAATNLPLQALSEHASKELFKKYGVPVTREVIVTSAQEAARAAKDIGYPVVMKVESAEILHKSDMGGVMLGIRDDVAAGEAFRRIMDNARKHKPEAKVNGVLIQEMLPEGLEMILGVHNDPQFGPVVLCGLGGVFVEVFKDVSLSPAPLNSCEALAMLQSLKAFPLFNGYRGRNVLDIEALAQTIVKIARFAADHKNTLSQLDINPLMVYPKGKGVCAVDALIINRQQED
ncbi:acetate--CoA ligase family protein [Candidatus Formimonas warabiya]|uniref:Acetyl-CoA synthetase n=1 Tax=Formimonas warabiya TaxID=1761012 RepID=A0A3G1L0J4_FORW1|nr:acetate--CoA ligase family protein [Candidatus Formimonas warabiya]ATW28149.1 acetyl-CoA synthetase [Candidatus Formimonas warabiya]